MIRMPRPARSVALAASACLGALQAGCASQPSAGPPTATPASVRPSTVTMAPIANPDAAAPARHEAPAEPRERPEPRTRAKLHDPPRGAVKPVAKPVAKPLAARVDPARARQLRSRGLEELNRGKVAPAVQLLRDASRLDPQNPLIRRDLERAERIDQAVHGRP